MRKLSMKWFWILFVCCVSSVTPCAIEKKSRNIICYYTNGINITPPESFNTKLCTHMNYAFIQLDANGHLLLNKKYTDNEKMIYKKVSSLKAANPNLKLLISLGDTTASQFAAIAADPLKRQNLVNSSVKFLENYGFDGVDVDWEKPTLKDKDNFVDLLKEMKQAFDEKNWLLSVAVFPYPYDGYNVTEISKYVDMIHLMCYNFYGPWSVYTGHNAALYSSPIESSYEKRRLNTNMCLQNWLDAGAPKEKINVGIPFYGRTFTLVNPEENTLHSPIQGAGKPSTPAYKQICLNFNNYTQVWDEEQKVSYKYYNDQWLSYEDERSIKEKAKYIKNHGVVGAMIWQIGQDDVNGDCGTKQGLLQIINQYLL